MKYNISYSATTSDDIVHVSEFSFFVNDPLDINDAIQSEIIDELAIFGIESLNITIKKA
jgi:hypothetical protein